MLYVFPPQPIVNHMPGILATAVTDQRDNDQWNDKQRDKDRRAERRFKHAQRW